jgi:hypothetical protein
VDVFEQALLPGLPVARIRAAYVSAPGKEIESGKFASPESSAALVANAFGYFLAAPSSLPPLPGTVAVGWPPTSVSLEAFVRFPWAGGRHPCLDVLIETPVALIGIESKRFEPFREKSTSALSDAYWRNVWGGRMRGYESVRDLLRSAPRHFAHLDATQLVKHAFGLRTAAQMRATRQAVLIYLYLEPAHWPDGRAVPQEERRKHRREIGEFACMVAADEVPFVACSYRELIDCWESSPSPDVRRHAAAFSTRFGIA